MLDTLRILLLILCAILAVAFIVSFRFGKKGLKIQFILTLVTVFVCFPAYVILFIYRFYVLF